MRLSFLLTGVLAIVLYSPAGAEVISLKNLIDNDLSILHGDKLFDEFEYYAVGDMPTAAGVNVIPFTDQEGNFGLTFQGGFVDAYGNGPSDALIRFRVTALGENLWISDAHLSGNPRAIGEAIMQVSETFMPEEPNEHLSIHHINPGNNSQSWDVVDFENLHKTLHVQKDILAFAQTEGSAAMISFIDQAFSQVIYIVPEPATIVTLIMGLALVGCFVRRNRS